MAFLGISLPLSLSMNIERNPVSPPLFRRALIPSRWPCPHDLLYLPKATPPNTITLRDRVLTYGLLGDANTQTTVVGKLGGHWYGIISKVPQALPTS